MSIAHELWIEPEQWQLETGDEFRADIRNGETFAGSALAWSDRTTARADLVSGDTQSRITGRLGDQPALVSSATSEGLLTLVYETTPSRITYPNWEKFQEFADHKALPITLDMHLENGLAPEKFTESYTRHAKSLIAVGSGLGADRTLGLQTEFVALANPYAPDFAGTLPVKLLYQGLPRTEAQVEIFERAPDGQVTVTTQLTDEEGQTDIPVRKGHSYLLDAVLLRAGSQGDAAYDTLWAALTFYVPD